MGSDVGLSAPPAEAGPGDNGIDRLDGVGEAEGAIGIPLERVEAHRGGGGVIGGDEAVCPPIVGDAFQVYEAAVDTLHCIDVAFDEGSKGTFDAPHLVSGLELMSALWSVLICFSHL